MKQRETGRGRSEGQEEIDGGMRNGVGVGWEREKERVREWEKEAHSLYI